MTQLNRSIERWKGCDPEAMTYHQSAAAIKFAFEDAKHDVLALHEIGVELLSLLEDAVTAFGPHIEGGDDEWLTFAKKAIIKARK